VLYYRPVFGEEDSRVVNGTLQSAELGQKVVMSCFVRTQIGVALRRHHLLVTPHNTTVNVHSRAAVQCNAHADADASRVNTST